MKIIAIIINGTHFPYQVVHHAIAKAKTENAEILAVFLKGEHEVSKGYIFPSDITSTDNSFIAGLPESQDENLITDNMQSAKAMVENEGILYRSVLKTNASVDDVVEMIKTASLLLIDKNFDEKTLLADKKISLDGLTKSVNIPIDIIEDY